MAGIDCILTCFLCTDTEECDVLSLQLHTLCLLFGCRIEIAVGLLAGRNRLGV